MHPMLRVAFECIRLSAKHILNSYERFDRHQPFVSPQGVAESLLIDALCERYPYLHCITHKNSIESISTVDAEWLCFVHALDGEENYRHGLPLFSSSIAFARINSRTQQYSIELALIYDPLQDHCYHAQKGHGAFLNQRRLRIHTPPFGQKAMQQVPLALLELQHLNHAKLLSDIGHVLSTRVIACPTLSCALIASGKADGILCDHLHPVDTCAGSLIIHEAGGMLAALDQEDFNWLKPGLYALGHAAFCGWLKHTWKP